MSVEVELERREISASKLGGAGRHVRAVTQKLRGRHGIADITSLDRERWLADVQAFGAELAVAKYLDRYWVEEDLDPHGDVGIRRPVGVRWRSNPRWDLILRRNDPRELPFVLVVGALPRYTLVGWILAGDGMQDEWWQPNGIGGNSREACWLVPQRSLRPVEKLLDTADLPSPFGWRFKGQQTLHLHSFQYLDQPGRDLFYNGPSKLTEPPTSNPLVEELDLEEFQR